MSDRPPFVVNAADVPENEASCPPPFDAAKLTLGRDLGGALGTVALGAWHERLLPGRRTSFTHAHSASEELVYVLSGHPHLRIIPPGEDPAEHALGPGDVVSFLPGTGIAHCFVNRSEADAVLLVVSDRPEGDRVRFPEHAELDAFLARERPHRHWGG